MIQPVLEKTQWQIGMKTRTDQRPTKTIQPLLLARPAIEPLISATVMIANDSMKQEKISVGIPWLVVASAPIPFMKTWSKLPIRPAPPTSPLKASE